jgi:hypothetical protein
MGLDDDLIDVAGSSIYVSTLHTVGALTLWSTTS